MTRTMYDGITASRLPTGAELVAGYVDGMFAWSAADWARFPASVKVRIAVFSSTNDGEVLDVEPGNATPAESVDWVLMRRRAGVDPTVYMNMGTWPTVRAAFEARGVAQPHYWVARYDGVASIPAGAVAKQYYNNDQAGYDLSAVADYWPGIDPTPEADMDAAQANQLQQVYNAIFYGGESMGEVPPGEPVNGIAASLDYLAKQGAKLDAVTTQVTGLAEQVKALAVPTVDPAALDAAVKAALTDPAVLKGLAHALAVELHGDLPAS